MKNKFYLLLLFLMAIISFQSQAQITFKLKSVVGSQNPSANGLFSYGTLNAGSFQLFPFYGEDGSGAGVNVSQKGWTFVLGQINYPFLAFEQLNAAEITPQPFPEFGIFMHPSFDKPSVVKLSIPNNATILSITNSIQRPSFGCGENIGYSIVTDNSDILARTIIATSSSPNTYMVGSTFINAGNNIYFIVDKGDDGNNYCDDTALDVEITLLYEKIVTPTISGTLSCQANHATFDVAFQQSGTLELYKVGNSNPIATTNISQVGNTFNGQGTFANLNLSSGGDYYVIAKNTGQTQSERSSIISITPCCTNAIAPSISVNNLSICQGQVGTLTATGCTNGTVSWNNGSTGTSISVSSDAGTYTATCKVLATPPCLDATSTASGIVTVNALPIFSVNNSICSADLLTYSINFSVDAGTIITSSLGSVAGNSVINIPKGIGVNLSATTINGCKTDFDVVAPNCSCPMVNAPTSKGNQTICFGQTILPLAVSVGENETGMPATADWYNESGVLVASGVLTYTPTMGGTYEVQARNLQSSCLSATRTPITLTIHSLPTLTIESTECAANLLTYKVAYSSNVTSISSSAGTVSAGFVSDIPNGTNVTLTATSLVGCSISQMLNAPDCVCPKVGKPLSGGDKTICQNETIPTLSATAGTNETIDWYNAPNGGTLLLANSKTFTPSSLQYRLGYPLGGIFYAEARNTVNQCISSTRTAIQLTINALGAVPVIIAAKNPLILGETTTLSVSNCAGKLAWSTGESSTSISISPISNSNYTATCASNSGCVGGIGTIDIVVSAPKIVVKASPTIVCVGGSTTLSMSNCPNNKIYWTSAEFGRTDEIAPTFSNLLQAIDFTGHCITSAGEASASVSVSIRQPQNFSIIASKNPIILGETIQLSTNGCDGTVSWMNGLLTGNPITVSPTSKYVEYVAECLSPNACGGKGKIVIEVKPPIIKAIGNDVCFGEKASLSQSGCASAAYWVVWKKADFSDAKSIDNPNTYPILEPTYFRVSCGSSAGESASDILIKPIPLPNKPEIIPNKESYLTGETAELNVLNCNGHLVWSTGEESSSQIRVKPKRTTTYSVTCFGGYNCRAESKIQVFVNTPEAKVKDLTLCYGDTLTFVSGCGTNAKAHWTENWLDIPNRIERKEGDKIRLFATNTYAVSCEDEAGFSKGVAFTTTVKPKIDAPTLVSKSATTIVKGDSLVIMAYSCNKTEWFFDEKTSNDTLNQIVVKPLKTTAFKARCLVDGCVSEEGSLNILVRPKMPVIKVSADTICAGSSINITAQNCEDGGFLQWLHDKNLKRLSFTANPSEDIVYESICMGTDGLVSDTLKTSIKVYQIPQKPSISGNLVIIEDQQTSLTATNCSETIIWSTGQTTRTILVNPTRNTTYWATCSQWYCSSERAEILVKVRPKQLELTDGEKSDYSITDTLCLQKQLTFSALTNCNGTIIWSNGQTGKSLTVTGLQNETYKVWCKNADKEVSDISTINIIIKDYNITDAYIYPNPTSGKLYIQSKGCIDGVMLRLFTLRGELIYEGGGQERYLDSLVLDLFNLPSEEYVLHIIGTDGTKPITLKKRVIKTNNN